MNAKAKSAHDQVPEDDRGHFWQPSERRHELSEEGRKWLEENADAIREWNDWIEKNGLPLAKYRPF